jgi:glutathione S-transferase
MKLYFFPIAPNPTKVRLYLAEKREAGARIPIEECLVNLIEGEQRSPEHLARNPLGKLPVLELDDGTFLTESLPIIELVEELYPEPPMIGSEPAERARERELERVADLGALIPIARIVHATNSPLGLEPNPGVETQAREALPRGLSVLDTALSDGRPFVVGERPTVADCSLAAGLQFARFRDVQLPDGFEHVRAWDERYRQRPAAKAVLVA